VSPFSYRNVLAADYVCFCVCLFYVFLLRRLFDDQPLIPVVLAMADQSIVVDTALLYFG
jgi:hypothetical protein